MLATPLENVYFGISRLPYFLGLLAVGLVSSFLSLGIRATQHSSLFPGAVIVVTLVLVAQRLKNIGMTPLWGLLIFVPIGNLWLSFRCITAQRGYIETRRLDPTGRVIAGIFVGFWVLMLALFVFTVFVIP